MLHYVTKLSKFCSYLVVIIIIAQFRSKINSIFRISAKNCIDPHNFQKKFFPSKNGCIPPQVIFTYKYLPVVPKGCIFQQKFFFWKLCGSMHFFALIPNMLFVLLYDTIIVMKTAKFGRIFSSFIWFHMMSLSSSLI